MTGLHAMPSIAEAIIAGIAAFAATNVDDLFLLMLYFSRANNDPARERSIIVGQYVGFSMLVLVSVVAYTATLLIPRHYVGWLGLLPVLLGVRELLERREGEDDGGRPDQSASVLERRPDSGPNTIRSRLFARLNPEVAAVAAVTIANGSDNIAVYTPLFAAGSVTRMMVIVAVFLLMVRVWCFAADWLAENPVTAGPVRRYGRPLMPFVLMAIGVVILVESGAIERLVAPLRRAG